MGDLCPHSDCKDTGTSNSLITQGADWSGTCICRTSWSEQNRVFVSLKNMQQIVLGMGAAVPVLVLMYNVLFTGFLTTAC